MNEKEKAKELFLKMQYKISQCEGNPKKEWEAAKQCTLIAVDEILNLPKDIWGEQYINAIKYWKEVKLEIQKL